ncbi:MAG: tRNA (cytidine(34)-2'-O)-methyltransferase [Clostridiales Family XIII bacterium]|jgi:tRNA (cytidine/uridine-2'-O-)-methyltransferase|nr:tRNA (cytidine(34)-2'-O)-methyltransferase [Clostridiales Family XIII bacterium]
MPFNIVLVEPEIPQNTGNIARTCAATGTVLHLVKPLGFDVSDRAAKRAGLDYWPFVKIREYECLADFLAKHAGRPMYFVTTKGKHGHAGLEYEPDSFFLFGKETAGLDEGLLRENYERTVRIPMLPDERLRSLNLANSAAVILYEALRQHAYPGLS